MTKFNTMLSINQVKTRKDYKVNDYYYCYVSKRLFASPCGAEVGTWEDKPKDKEQNKDKNPMCYPVMPCR